ncbi:hypothetical protein SLA2020_243630 [Shorea laevis]
MRRREEVGETAQFWRIGVWIAEETVGREVWMCWIRVWWESTACSASEEMKVWLVSGFLGFSSLVGFGFDPLPRGLRLEMVIDEKGDTGRKREEATGPF